MGRRHSNPFVAFILLSALLLPALAMAGIGNEEINVEPTTDIMVQSFDGVTFPPTGWATIHAGSSYTWSRTSMASNSGTYSAYIMDGAAGQVQDEYLVSEALDLSMHNAPLLGWYEEESNWYSRGGTHYIMVSTTSQTDPAAFEVVMEMTPATHNIGGFGGTQIVVDLGAFAGEPTVYVAFRYVGEDADYWFVDDVKLFELVSGSDVTPAAVNPSEMSFNHGDVMTPSADIFNNGTELAELDVTMEILESGDLVYTETTHINNLDSDATQVVNFPQYTVNEGHLIELRCTTTMDGDQNPLNDTRSSYNYAYTQPHVPMGLLFTNAACLPCINANQTLDAYIPTQGNDVALARIHVSWPGSDIMYSANSGQSNTMTQDYGVSGVPTMFIDGMEVGSYYNFASTYNQRKLLKSPMSIELAFNDETDELTVKVHNVEMMVGLESLKLRAYITEDNVYYAGSNGETHHQQAMRRIFPDTYGLDCPTTMGTHTYVLNTPLNAGWSYDNLRATVYLQDMDTRLMHQAGTEFLKDIDDGVAPVGDLVVSAVKLSANYPNPFNPSTTISFDLPRNEQAELSVYSVDGAKVATLVNGVMAEGHHEVVWAGKDSKGATVGSGVYFYRLVTPSSTQTRVMTLVK